MLPVRSDSTASAIQGRARNIAHDEINHRLRLDHGVPGVFCKNMDLKEEEILRDSINDHWYYRAKARALRRCLGKNSFNSILDVGAGSGYFSRYLLNIGYAQKSTCVDSNYSKEYVETLDGKSIEFKRSIQRSDAELMLMMDVIEHVDDDIALIKEYAGMLETGSTILITVPAFEFLWSGHDVFLGHKRRYTRRSLIRTVEAAQLKIVNASYFYAFLFPLAAAKRLSQKFRKTTPKSELKRHNAFTNQLLLGICFCELPIFELNRLAGLTVFCLAKKS